MLKFSTVLKNISILIFIVFTMGACTSEKDDEQLIRDTFENYKNAILTDNGQEAAKYVDSRTIEYYTEILERTKNSDSLEIDKLSMVNKLMVLMIRHKASQKNITSFTGEELFIYAINEGMVGKSSVSNSSIGEIKVNGTFAKGQFVSNGDESPFSYHFYNEDNMWKIDLTSVMSFGEVAFKKLQQESGLEENQFILNLLEMTSGKVPDDDIWQSYL